MTRAEQYLQAHQQQTGADLYGGMRQAGLNTSPEMESLLASNPAVQESLSTVRANAAHTGTTLSPVDEMHQVKRTLNLIADAKMQGGKAVDKNAVAGLADQWERAFWEANPQARVADTGYAQAMGLSNPKTHEGDLQQGRRFLQAGMSDQAQAVSPDALFDRFSGGNPQAKSIFQVGATNAMRDEARQGTPGALRLATKLGPDYPDLANKITQIYGPERAAEMQRASSANRTFAETKNALLGGSQTAEKLTDAREVGNARINITPSGLRERATEHVRNLIGKIENPNEAVLNKIGELMIQPKDKERLIELLMKASNRRAGTRLPAGAVAAGASSVGSNY